jgi:hypothetical protein
MALPTPLPSLRPTPRAPVGIAGVRRRHAAGSIGRAALTSLVLSLALLSSPPCAADCPACSLGGLRTCAGIRDALRGHGRQPCRGNGTAATAAVQRQPGRPSASSRPVIKLGVCYGAIHVTQSYFRHHESESQSRALGWRKCPSGRGDRGGDVPAPSLLELAQPVADLRPAD